MHLENGIWKWNYTPTVNKTTGYEDLIPAIAEVSKQEFNSKTRSEQMSIAKEALDIIRTRNVFPIYYYTDAGVAEEIAMCTFNSPTCINGTLDVHGKAGSLLLDFMFPNMHRVDVAKSRNNCVYNRFYDDEKLLKCLRRYIDQYAFTNVRTMFFMYGRFFWGTATNFSMARAKAIYNELLPEGGVIYDYACGFGARMLGALTDTRAEYIYIGAEPDTNTFYNLQRLGSRIEDVTHRRDSFNVFNTGSEVLELESNSVDLAFSCPPYYALERYSAEPTQCYVKYPAYNDWLSQYTEQTMINIYRALKPGGTFAFVIGNATISGVDYPLQQDWCRIAASVGFKYTNTYPIYSNTRKKLGKDSLFIFKK